MRRARCSRVLLVAGAACLLAAATPLAGALAAEEPGSGFGSFSLAANAPVVQLREDDGGNCSGEPGGTAGCEGVVPETVSTLAKGPIGFALSSVAWPGTLAGNLGTLLIVSGNGAVPQEATILNSPVRAEARTGQDPATQTTTDRPPGTTMTATALPDEVKAAAEVAQSAAGAFGSFGNATSSSRTAVTGVRTAVAEADSRVSNVALAGGVVKIGSVTSTARGSTDGTTATAQGATTVNGMTIAGVPVVVDDDGVHVAGQGGPLNKTASDAVNAAIKNLNMTITISQPMSTGEGPNLVFNAGSLIFTWQQTEAATMSVVLGGASLSLASSEGFAFATPELPPFQGGTGPLPPFVPADPPPFVPPATDVGDAPLALAPPEPAPVSADPPPPSAPLVPVTAARPLSLFDGLPIGAVLLGLAGVGLVAAGLRRLPDTVLAGGGCPLEETP